MIVIFLATFAGMEAFAWATHRWVMHGALWCWHESHHQPRTGRFEKNDLFAVVFAMPAIVLIAIGVNAWIWALPIGLGVTAYGAAYAFFHDGLVHKRWRVGVSGRSSFWRKRIQAHRLHHAIHTKEGCISFGFLWVQPVRVLTDQLRRKRAGSPGGT